MKLIEGVTEPSASIFARVFRFLRRRMPYVAIAATVCFVLWLLISGFGVYRTSVIGSLFGTLTFLLVAFTILYYAARAFRWTKRHLSAAELLHLLFDEIDEWSAGQERGDDQTLVVIKAREGDVETAEML